MSTHSTFSSSGGSQSHTKANRVPLNWSGLSLVGRAEELATLHAALERVRRTSTTRSSEIVLIGGESGSGKSALVKSLETSVEQQRMASTDIPCFFISGKYQQGLNTSSSNRSSTSARPYGAIVDALTELCHLIRSSKKEQQDAIQRSIQSKLSEKECETLGRLMPIRLVVDTDSLQTPQPRKGTRAQQMHTEHTSHIFKLLFRTFLDAVCAHAHLVMFLDDIQWGDKASQELLASLASDTRSQNLLLIGAVRGDLEAGKAMIMRTEKDTLPSSTIILGPLTLEDVNFIVSSVTEQRLEQTSSLSEVVFHKTNGNPYFSIQYIEMLHRQGLLEFSFATNTWEWNVDTINMQTDVSDNVVSLLTDKIADMSRDVQVALMLGACLGFAFQVDVLELIMAATDFSMGEAGIGGETKEESSDLTQVLDDAVRAGLIEAASSTGTYKFSHDRVQQSAFALFPVGDVGERLLFCIGKTVLDLSRSVAHAEDWMLFISVDLLSRSASSVPMNKEDMSRLCLEAAHKAADKSAFISSAGYADKGLAYLHAKTRWKDHYHLCLELTKLSAEMHYASGGFDKSSRSISEVLGNARSLKDKLRAYSVSVAILGAKQDLIGAIRQGGIVLNRLGVKSPSPEKASSRQIVSGLATAKKLLKGRKAADLRDLPPMTNPVLEEATRLITTLQGYEWRSGHKNLLIIHVLIMFQITLEHGIGVFSPFAFSCYGALMAHLGKLEEASEYADLALGLIDRPGMKEGYSHAVKNVVLVLYHLKKPIFASLDLTLQAYRVAKEIGQIEVAAYCLQAHGMLSAVVGMPLDSLEIQMLSYCNFCREFRLKAVLMDLLPFYQLTLNLLGKCENPLVLSGSGMIEEVFVGDLVRSNGGASSMLLLGYARLILLFLFDELELAETERLKMDVKKDFASTYFMKYLNYFFCGMICMSMVKKAKRPRKHKKLAKWYMGELRKIAQAGSPNFIPMLKVLEAEKLALKKGRGGDVSETFDTAIQMSGRCGFRLIKAIACERSGLYSLGCGDTRVAVDYLSRAREEFAGYGASGKVYQMDEKYGGLEEYIAGVREASLSISSGAMKPHLVENWKQKL